VEGAAIGRSGVEARLILIATIVLLGLAVLPIAMVIAISFTAGTTVQFPPPGLSLRWYREVWEMLAAEPSGLSRLRESLVASLEIAAATSVLCLVTGLPAAYALVRRRFRGRVLAEELLGLPVVFPTVVLGIALLVIVSATGIDFGAFQIVVAHAIIGLPFMIRNCTAALHGLDPALEEAARTLGASAPRAFWEVVLPLIRGGVASGAILVFVLSFNEFTLCYFLYTIDVFPLSIWLFQQSNTSFSPAVFAVSALLVLLNVLIITGVDLAIGRTGRRARA
jgi:putative spermidine/putrescine transport system permease protein